MSRFRSRSGRTDSETQLTSQFPFLPSYDMAINDARVNPQSTGTPTPNTSIDDGVIMVISNLGVTPTLEDQSDPIETSYSGVNTPPSIDNTGVIVDLSRLSVIASPENQSDSFRMNCFSVNSTPCNDIIESLMVMDIHGLSVASSTDTLGLCRVNTPPS